MLSELSKVVFVFLFAFFISVICGPFILNILKKAKAKQEILNYVTQHNTKAGTPTMGGIVFIFSTIIVSLLFVEYAFKEVVVLLIFSVFIFLIGLFDDLKKIKGKKNEGLSPIQKLIFQIVIGGGFAVYLFLNGYTFFRIPFVNEYINFSYFIIPIAIFFVVYFTNSANLTDGLDGLVSTITVTITAVFGLFLCVFQARGFFEIENFQEIRESFGFVLEIFSGAILGFIFLNTYPAKMFMGDSGSLFIGALLSAVALMTGEIVLLFIFTIVFFLETLSVVLQVGYYKLKKKRIFLMTPIHHHFEKKGVHENRIVVGFNFLTIVVCFVSFLIELI